MRNTILIVFDELTSFNNLPKEITDKLKGYQLFKKKCVEFTNIQTARQQCSPSRSTIMTGIYDTMIQDNVEFNYQYAYVPNLPYELNTIAKIYKSNGCDITTYYGKQHVDGKLAVGVYSKPRFNSATVDCMKAYGYDKFNVFGDTYYDQKEGLLSDNQVISYELPPNSLDFDYIEGKSKYSGVIPFIKARLQDSKSYYLECHIINPHDTNHYIQNLKNDGTGVMNQFPTPFLEEQLKEGGYDNPYYFNDANKIAVPTNPNLVKNYFENDYLEYKTNRYSLPFLTSYELDYAIEPKINSYNPFLIGTYYAIGQSMTIADSQNDVKSWKNFLNNFYGLVFEADSYLEKLYYFFESNGIFDTTNIIIISDHGDQLSSHGLKQKQLPFKESSNVCCLIHSADLACDLIGKNSDIYGSLIDILPTQLVLNNMRQIDKTDGKSLLVWKYGKLHLNLVEHSNYVPLNIVNSTMYALGYFFYYPWYARNYKGQSLTSNPSNYFEFQSNFSSIITNVGNQTLKFGRYYSIHSIIKYHLFIKNEQNIFFKKDLLEYISNLDILLREGSLAFFKDVFPIVFNFEEGLEIIEYNFANKNIYLCYVYYGFISKVLNDNLNGNYIFVGSESSWEQNEKLNIFSYFLYDLKLDPSESYNLLDPKNISNVDINLKQTLNDILNLSIHEKKCSKLRTFVAENTIQSLAKILYVIGGFLTQSTNNIVYETLYSLGGYNAIDTQPTILYRQIIQDYINNSVNLINFTNYKNPYNLYDCANKIYYVGEKEYIEYIYENFNYFSKMTIDKGLPNIKNKKYSLRSNNILPNLSVVKI